MKNNEEMALALGGKTFIDEVYEENEEEFKNRYCEVNHITKRQNKVQDEQGEISYSKVLYKK